MKKTALFLALLVLLTVGLCVAVGAEEMDHSSASADSHDILLRIIIGFAIGLVLASVIVLVMVRKMSTVRSARTADNYVKQNSFRLTESRDVYLYSRVTRVRVNDSSHKR